MDRITSFLGFYFCTLFIPLCNGDTTIHGLLFGPGVCSQHTTDTKTVRVTKMNLDNETTWELCWNLPPWCTVYSRTVYEFDKTNEDIPHEHLTLMCCQGWKMNLNKTGCLPICSPLCLYGFCVDLNNCSRCQSGYSGESCEEHVPSPKPNITCNCPNDNFVCDKNGKCLCAPGFEGPDCIDLVGPSQFIIDSKVNPCQYYILQVLILLCLLGGSLCIIIYALKKRRAGISHQPLDESVVEPSTSGEA